MNKNPGQNQIKRMQDQNKRMQDQNKRMQDMRARSQNHLQDMMARSQKQMADQRQRSKRMARMQKQQEEARQREDAAKDGKGSGGATTSWQGRGYFQADERFSQVEDEVARLKKQVNADRLTEEAFDKQLKDLIVEDENGDWWMIGTKSNAWYRFDGQNWIQSTPPGRWVQDDSAVSGARSIFKEDALLYGHPIRAIFLFLFMLALFAVLGVLSGVFVVEVLDVQKGDIAPYIPAVFIWVFGFFFAINRARRTWRGF